MMCPRCDDVMVLDEYFDAVGMSCGRCGLFLEHGVESVAA